MEELEKLYNELPYFDKQKFLGRHLAYARQEDIDKKASDYSEEEDDDVIRMMAIEEACTSELKEELESRGYLVISKWL